MVCKSYCFSAYEYRTYEWKSIGALDIAAMYSANETLLSPDVSARLKKACGEKQKASWKFDDWPRFVNFFSG